ncbi:MULTISPECIES: hypothetical protein [Bacillus]|uniref:hypothetical protein n=1 Tax=Bacillus TaxID=1386 RepID=UPI0006F5D7C3|nr:MULTISPECIES: hypothetical protein [Bacillus]APJ11129.1 hypothetical protein BSL056_09225 [Bacillus safensis]KQU12056.1 hypothetical protein ASG46_05820 [Bacillus sp. Leaf49]
MCKATNYIREIEAKAIELNEIKEKIDKDIEFYRKEVSRMDKELSKFYHDLEVAVFNACEGWSLSKRGQAILIERRKVKSEYEKLCMIRDMLGKSLLSIDNEAIKTIENAKRRINKTNNKLIQWKSESKKNHLKAI